MTINQYQLTLAAALVIGMCLTALRMKRRLMNPTIALAAIPVSGILGVALAWLVYQALMFMMPISSFRFSFIGGMMGVILGLVIMALFFRTEVLAVLDVAAAPLCLTVCIARLGEYFVENIGWGVALEGDGWYFRFPFAVELVWDDYFEEWSGYAAVFMLEAALALIAFFLVLKICEKRHWMTGSVFYRSLCLLAIPQILSEQLRSMTMAWGFVRVEQIMCAIIAAVILTIDCAKWRAKVPVIKRWWPMAVLVLCVVAVICAEFALDGKYFTMTTQTSYIVFCAALCVMLGMTEYASWRRSNPKV